MSIFNKKQKKEEAAVWNFERGVLGALVSSLEEAVIIYDKDFKVVDLNRAAEEIFGIKAKELIGQNISLDKTRNLKSKILAQVMFTSLAPVVVRKTEAGVYPQITEVSLDEPKKELRIITNLIIDNNNQTWGFLKTVKDRTRELELLRAKSDFVTIAAHKLRTPTTAVGWALDTLAKEQSLSEQGRQLVDITQKAARNLLEIINDLINITQIEEGKFGYKFQKTKLVPFLEKLLSEAEVIAREYKVKIYFERPTNKDVSVPLDAARLGMAIANVIDNAIKYNVENGQVAIVLKELPGQPYVQVEVKDTGVGIPEEDLPKIFNKFFRAENIKEKDVEGTGLGLYLTKNIIERHGGKIWVESELNRGTVFYFTLPADPALISLKQLEN